ncbi:MAG: hypothetical protein J5700_02460 [Treponema sp.]|nr:hypothetical protein [Treponema sp.]
MDGRPDFSQIKSFEEFSKYYWYREELQKICKGLGLDSRGMKAELNHVIEEYFKGNRIAPKVKASPKAVGAKIAGRATGAVGNPCAASMPKNRAAAKLSLSTGLIECGFTFGPRFRDFFSAQTGVAKFKFNVDMVATAKKVKQDGDTSFTLGDLLDVYYGKKTYAKYDKICLQWNKFVQDFCADPASAAFPNKLKAAAALWKQVRDSTRPKIYTHQLLEENKYGV